MANAMANRKGCLDACSAYPSIIVILVSILLASPALASGELYISQVLYNPLGTESGGEAVELYNPTNDAIDISGYTLKTASSVQDALLPGGSIIFGKGHFLIADAGWSTKKDSIAWPDADYEEAITLLNTNAGVALIDRSNHTLDSVGWGDANSMDSSLFSIQPANYSQDGESLKRVSFTGNNGIDFASKQPFFINSKGENSSLSANQISIDVSIVDMKSFIYNISIGKSNKVVLLPGQTRDVDIMIYSAVGFAWDDVTASFSGRSYSLSLSQSEGQGQTEYRIYSGKIPFAYYTAPGNYTAFVTSRKGTEYIYSNVTFEVSALLAFEMDLQRINCTMTFNRSCLIIGDRDTGTNDKPTLRNIGNKVLDFKVYAYNLSSDSAQIPADNMRFSFDSSEPANRLSNIPGMYNIALVPGIDSTVPISLLISVPDNARAGMYSSRLFLLGVANA